MFNQIKSIFDPSKDTDIRHLLQVIKILSLFSSHSSPDLCKYIDSLMEILSQNMDVFEALPEEEQTEFTNWFQSAKDIPTSIQKFLDTAA